MSSSQSSAERDARDLDRGLVVNLIGYVLKLAQPALLVWVVRSYGTESWGQYTVCEAVLLLSLRVVLLGFDKTMLWWVPRMSSDVHALARLRGAFLCVLACAACGALLIGTFLAAPLSSWRGDSSAANALQWMAWSLVPMALMELFIAGALGKRRMESQVFVRDGLVSLSFVVFALCFFFGGLRDHGLSLAHFLSNSLGALVSGIVFLRLYGRGGVLGAPGLPSAEIVRYSVPAWGTELFSSAVQRLDVLAVSYWGTPALVGVYGVVTRVGNAVRSVRRSYDPIVTALMSDIAAQRDKARLAAAFSRATVLVMLTQTPIFAALALFADDLMRLFGTDFQPAVMPVLIICAFWLLNGTFGLNGLIVSGYGRSDLILLDLILSTVLQAVLLYLLVPGYGLIGASFAVGIGYVATNLLQVAQGYLLSGKNPYTRDVARAALASLAALAAGALVLWASLGLGHWPSRLAATAAVCAVLFRYGRPALRAREATSSVGSGAV